MITSTTRETSLPVAFECDPTASKIIRDLRAENVRLRDRLRALETEAALARTT